MLKKFFRQLIFYSILIGIWQVLFSLNIWPPYLFPSPGDVLGTLVEGFSNSSFWVAIGVSMRRLLIGYVLSVLFGVMLGVVIGKIKSLDETVGGFFVGVQTLPSICWLPLAILWFGLGEMSILFVILMGSLLSVSIATDGGVKNIQPIYLKAGRNMGAKGKDMLVHVILPAAFPSILAGLKQGWSFAWRSLMGAEIVFSTLGLGHLLNVGRDLNDMSLVLSVMIVIIVIGIAIESLVFGLLERKTRQIWGVEKR